RSAAKPGTLHPLARRAPASSGRLGPRQALCDGVEGVEGGIVDPLLQTAGPADFGPVDLGAVAQAEVQRLRRLRQIAAGGVDLADHHLLAQVQSNQGTDRVAVAAGSAGRVALAPRAGQPEGDVVLRGELIAEVEGAVVEV